MAETKESVLKNPPEPTVLLSDDRSGAGSRYPTILIGRIRWRFPSVDFASPN
jgi:hypothetical protein